MIRQVDLNPIDLGYAASTGMENLEHS
jgi:hypothetical protein